MKHTITTLALLLSVLTSPATLVRFNMADITGRTNDLPITVQGLVMPFGSSNYVVIGYPQRLQPVGGTITTNLVPGSYRLSVIGPSPAQTLDFNVTNSASVLDVRDLGSYKLSSFTASQYYTSEQSDARYLPVAHQTVSLTNTTAYGTFSAKSNLAVGPFNQFSVDGSGNVDAQYLTAPVIDSAQFRGSFTGDGGGLTNVSGTVSNYASDYYASSRPVFVREPVRPLGHAAGRTLPPMGYAPWNTFACSVSETVISNQMRWMINRGLRTAGYTNTVDISDGWQTGRDGDGKPTVDATRYPNGFPWLTDWARTNGFRMTVWTPADFYNYYTNGAIAIGSCGSSFRQGSGGYELIDAWWYVTNGFKSVKYDYFGYAGDLVATTSNFWWAVNQTGVDFPIDSVGYADPFYPALIDYCSTLRVARDIRPTWAYVMYQVDEMDKNAKYQRPGFWPHPDMMVVGVTNAYGSLSTHEAVSHFGLWCIMGSPLIIGADCSTLSATLNALLTNAAYIAIDQDPLCAQGRRVKSELVPTGDLQVWVKPLGSYNSGTNAVLLLNNSGAASYVYVFWDEIGLGTNCHVLDLTTPADRGQQTGFYREYLASHQSVLLKVTGTPRQGVTLTATPRAMVYNTMSNVFLAGTFRGDARTLTNYSTTNLIGSYVGDGSGLTGVTANTLINAANVTNLSVWGSGPADGTRLWYMDEQLAYTAGTWYFGGGVDFSGAEVEGLVGITTTASGVPLAARGTAAQTANLFEAQDSASNVVASVSAAGVFTGNGIGLTNLSFSSLQYGGIGSGIASGTMSGGSVAVEDGSEDIGGGIILTAGRDTASTFYGPVLRLSGSEASQAGTASLYGGNTTVALAGNFSATGASVSQGGTAAIEGGSGILSGVTGGDAVITSGSGVDAPPGIIRFNIGIGTPLLSAGVSTNGLFGNGSGLTNLNAGQLIGTMPAEVAGSFVTPPLGLAPPVAVYCRGQSYWTDFAHTNYDVSRTATYYMLTNGSDSADGLSWATAKASVSNVFATAGSGSLKVWLGPGTYPTTLVAMHTNDLSMVCTGGVAIVPPVVLTNGSGYLQNIEFVGGTNAFRWVVGTAASNTLVAIDCIASGASSDGWFSSVQAGLSYLLRCEARTNGADGFNYESSSTATTLVGIEENCVSVWNGRGTFSNNGSTMHEGASMVRVGGWYVGNGGRNVADIGDGYSWSVGCVAGAGSVFGSGNDVAFAAGGTGDATRMFLDDCGAVAGSEFTYLSGVGAKITVFRPRLGEWWSTYTAVNSITNNITVDSTMTRIGDSAGNPGSTGVAIGINAFRSGATSSGITTVGSAAGRFVTSGANAALFGVNAGNSGTNASGMVAVGGNAGRYAGNATNAVFLGLSAGQIGTNAARSIFIGPFSGTNRADTIWIDTKSTAADGSYLPLILGYCDQRQLIVNGTLTASNVFVSCPSNGVASPTFVQPVGVFGNLQYFTGTNTCAIRDGVYTNLAASAAYTDILTNGFAGSASNGTLTCLYAGFYPIHIGIVVATGAANLNDEIELEAFVDETATEKISCHAILGGVASLTTLNWTGRIYLPANSVISLRVKGLGTTDALPIIHAVLDIGN